MKKSLLLSLLILLTLAPSSPAWYPRLKQEMRVTQESRIVGHNRETRMSAGETLMEMARHEGVGFDNLLRANPGVDPWNPLPGGRLVLPTAVLLPGEMPDGITINLAELRLYLIWNEDRVRRVRFYPVGIGREGWATPLGEFHVKLIIDNPDWTPPVPVRKERPELPGTVPPGPDNPLGRYWIGLSAAGIGIHGTNQPFGVGRRVSHGCIRLYPPDIADLAAHVGPGTRVRIIDQPVKHMVRDGVLYLEVYRRTDRAALAALQAGNWNMDLIARTLREARGLPVEIPAAR